MRSFPTLSPITVLGLTLIVMAPGSTAISKQPARVSPGFAETIGIDLVPIESGEFWMGSATRPTLPRPRHQVRITQPFLMAAHEVTIGQFRRFVEATGYRTEAERDGRATVGAKVALFGADTGFPQR